MGISTAQKIKKLKKLSISQDFLMLYNFFTEDTRKNLHDVFYSCMKILHFRYKRKKIVFEKRRLKKKQPLRNFYQLSKSDVSSALTLVDHYLANVYVIPSEKDPLKNFGNFPYEDAARYYNEFVKGSITDVYGREVEIDDNGLNFLFENHD